MKRYYTDYCLNPSFEIESHVKDWIMNFFKWLRWVFSNQTTIKFEGCTFTDIKEDTLYKKNGTFYAYNIQYKFIDCEFLEYKEPEPNVVDVKIDMNYSFSDIFVGIPESNEQYIIPSKEPLPFEITYSLEPQLSKQEKEDLKTIRFVDAMIEWDKRHKN